MIEMKEIQLFAKFKRGYIILFKCGNHYHINKLNNTPIEANNIPNINICQDLFSASTGFVRRLITIKFDLAKYI